MTHFLSCDWGTSSFRLKLVELEGLNIIKEVATDQGIAATFILWQKRDISNKNEKRQFYLNIINEHIQKIKNSINFSLDGLPLVISGMASSSIGIEELPYADLPFNVDGSDAITQLLEANEGFQHPVLLISGVKNEKDVMRGEETQLVGAYNLVKGIKISRKETEKVFIFPGTHSKHIFIKDEEIIDFKTFMTGEYYDLLVNKSILSLGVAKDQDLHKQKKTKSFKKGVVDGLSTNLLHATFRVRTNHLFGKLTKQENGNYLSGLLIGNELLDLISLKAVDTPLYLCGSSGLNDLYHTALIEIGLGANLRHLPFSSDEAVINGQLIIYKNFLMK